MIWGCLIGLPAFIFAESLSQTSMFQPLLGAPPSDAALGLLYLLNGILVAFVFEAVRRPRVIDVAIPLRRVTLFALLVGPPIFWLGEQITALHEELHLPPWKSCTFRPGPGCSAAASLPSSSPGSTTSPPS